MGIFDIFFTKKVKTYEKISFEKLQEAAEKKITEHEESFKQEAKSFFAKAKQQEEKIKADLERLTSAKVTDQVDPELLKVAETSRKSFARKVESLIEREEQQEFSIDSHFEAYNSFLARFKEIDSSTVAEFAAIKEVFKESQSVVDEMKVLKKYFDDFGENLKNVESKIEPFKEIANKIKIIKDENEKLENYKKDLEDIFQKNENLKKENEMLKINLQKLEESGEWKNYLQMKRDLEETEIEKREIISQVVQKFASVERPLKKVNNLLQNGEINKKVFDKYFASTFDAFIEDYDKSVINAALKEAEKAIAAKKISIKGEEKSLDKIREMISADVFSELGRQWQKVNDEISELNLKIENSEVEKKRNEMIKIISDRENEMKQNRKEKIEQQIKILEQNLAAEKDGLQKLAKDNMLMEIEF
jgi:hypothetical protein